MTGHNGSHPDKLKKFWDTVILRSEDEQMMDQYNSLFSLLDINFIEFLNLTKVQKWNKIKKYAIVEFLPKNKLKTLITKLNSVKNNSLITQLLQILEALLISIVKDLKPFWTESINRKSQKLWLPTEIGSHDSASNCSNISLNNMESNSWFSIKSSRAILKNSMMTSSQLLQSSQLDTMENGNIKVLRSRKIKLFLNSNQKQIFLKWIGTSRYLYNQSIEYINSDQPYLPKGKLRTKYVTNVSEELNWQRNVPQGVREGAVFEAHTAYTTNLKKYKKNGTPFELKFRARKNQSQSIVLPIDSLKKDFRLYPRLLGKNSCVLKMYETEQENIKFKTKFINQLKPMTDENGKILKDKNGKIKKEETGKKLNRGQILNHTIRIQRLRTGEWYLCIPIEVEVKNPENQGAIISLDPGVRTFLTGYSPDGSVYKFGDDDIKQIRNYLLKTDKLQSLLSQIHGQKRNRYKMAFLKRLRNVRNRIKDCHRKVVKYLVDGFDIIIVPVFHAKAMSQRGARKINSKTVRNMMGWSHYKFRMMLINKVLEYRNKRILLPSEEYTSKTCTRCGYIKNNLGGAKLYSCNQCGLRIDRDINGSRNILLKTISSLDAVVTSTCLTLGPLLSD